MRQHVLIETNHGWQPAIMDEFGNLNFASPPICVRCDLPISSREPLAKQPCPSPVPGRAAYKVAHIGCVQAPIGGFRRPQIGRRVS